MSTITELEDKVKELMNEIETLKQQEKIEKFEYLFENCEDYWVLYQDGSTNNGTWNNHEIDCKRYDQGNIFKTQREAKRESERRALLTRFRQFRDKCNGDWKPDFKNDSSWKIYIGFNHNENKMKVCSYLILEEFNLFGYFKNEADAERAVELFGDEIKRLWVEE